jgi:uncharacterized protein YlxP (DUF503 family)
MFDLDERIFLGAARIQLHVPGARTLKDRRQNVRSVSDRMRHKFSVTVNEVGTSDYPGRQVLVVTTGGNDAGLIRSILDQCAALANSSGRVLVEAVDVDVFRWHAGMRRWTDESDDSSFENGYSEDPFDDS